MQSYCDVNEKFENMTIPKYRLVKLNAKNVYETHERGEEKFVESSSARLTMIGRTFGNDGRCRDFVKTYFQLLEIKYLIKSFLKFHSKGISRD